VRTARKHIGWYVRGLPGGEAFRGDMNRIEDCDRQLKAVADFFDGLAAQHDRMPIAIAEATIDSESEEEAAACRAA
jgi:tRNA-dihydrouridine synthase B